MKRTKSLRLDHRACGREGPCLLTHPLPSSHEEPLDPPPTSSVIQTGAGGASVPLRWAPLCKAKNRHCLVLAEKQEGE